jgi:hypothetical protein
VQAANAITTMAAGMVTTCRISSPPGDKDTALACRLQLSRSTGPLLSAMPKRSKDDPHALAALVVAARHGAGFGSLLLE